MGFGSVVFVVLAGLGTLFSGCARAQDIASLKGQIRVESLS